MAGSYYNHMLYYLLDFSRQFHLINMFAAKIGDNNPIDKKGAASADSASHR